MLDMAGSLSLSDDFEILSINSQGGSDIDWEGEYHLSDDDLSEDTTIRNTSAENDASKSSSADTKKRNSKQSTKGLSSVNFEEDSEKNSKAQSIENSKDSLKDSLKDNSKESSKKYPKKTSKEKTQRVSKNSKNPSSSSKSASNGINLSKAEQLALYMEAIDDEEDEYSNDDINDEEINDISDFDESDLSQRLRPSNFSLVFPEVDAALNLSSTDLTDDGDSKLNDIKAFLLLGSSPSIEVIGHQLVDACNDKLVLHLFTSGETSVVHNNDKLIDGEILKVDPKDTEQQFEYFRSLNRSQIVLVRVLDDESPVSVLTMFGAKSKLGDKFISSQLLEISKDHTEWVLDGCPIPNALNTDSLKLSRNAGSDRRHVVSHLTRGFFPNFDTASPNLFSLLYVLSAALSVLVLVATFTSLYLGTQYVNQTSPAAVPTAAPTSNLPAVVVEAENSLSSICVQSKDAIAWLLSTVELYLRQYVKEATNAAREAHKVVKVAYADGMHSLGLLNHNSLELYASIRSQLQEALDTVKELKA